MTDRPPDGHDEPATDDPVMLAVLANSGRESALLSPDQEKLLDDWMAGALSTEDAARAAVLVSRNALAAERVLECRLLAAAASGPPVPESLSSHVLSRRAPPSSAASRPWWTTFGRWQWMGIAGALAVASVLAVAVVPLLQGLHVVPVQVAMVTIGDRDALFEPSDIRRRDGAPPPPAADLRFRDVEIPTSVLERLLAPPSSSQAPVVARELETYLPTGSDEPIRLIVDRALRQRVESQRGEPRIAVRLYDLADPRSAALRRLVDTLPDTGRAYLLTTVP
ncbi:hypothetical protein [Reyranella sp.]|uniref:hypothetical protein n=1 Tax=Reyranella sp. TaxID=1929291 RepID=UPI003BAD92FC